MSSLSPLIVHRHTLHNACLNGRGVREQVGVTGPHESAQNIEQSRVDSR